MRVTPRRKVGRIGFRHQHMCGARRARNLKNIAFDWRRYPEIEAVILAVEEITMQTAPAENDAKVRKLIEAARKEPVLVLDYGEPAAVVLSLSEFDRLEETDRLRRDAARLRKTISASQAEAAKSGLTEEELNRLLAGDS